MKPTGQKATFPALTASLLLRDTQRTYHTGIIQSNITITRNTTFKTSKILSLGNVLNAGFDQIYNLYNPLVYSTGDIIDTWVYRAGLQNLQYSLATAVGLFKSVISVILIALGYRLADKFTGYKLF